MENNNIFNENSGMETEEVVTAAETEAVEETVEAAEEIAEAAEETVEAAEEIAEAAEETVEAAEETVSEDSAPSAEELAATADYVVGAPEAAAVTAAAATTAAVVATESNDINAYRPFDYSAQSLGTVYGETGEQLTKEELKAEKKKRIKKFNLNSFLVGVMMIIFAVIMNFVGSYINQLAMYIAIPDVVSEVFSEGGLAGVESFYYNEYCNEEGKYFATSGITDNIGYCFFVLLYMIPFAIFGLTQKLRGKIMCKGEKFSGRFLLVGTVVGMGFIYLWAYIYNVAAMLIDFLDLNYIFTLFSANSNAAFATPLGTAFYLISTCIFAPLGEEFVCRGVILGSLRKYGNWWAIAVTAMLFGLMHMNFYQGPYAFLMGMVLGFVTVKTGSIWCAVLIHMINNSWSCLLETITHFVPALSGVMDVLSVILMFGLMLGSVVLLIVLAAKGKLSLPKEHESPRLRVRAKTLRFCLSPLNLLYIGFCLLYCVLLVLPQA